VVASPHLDHLITWYDVATSAGWECVSVVVTEQDESTLRRKLRELSQRSGVRRDNLADFLGWELRAFWHIEANDSPEVVFIKVAWQLERLISQLRKEDHRVVARYCFNVTGLRDVEGKDLGGRQDALADRRERPRPSARASRYYMSNVILPQFEASLRSDLAPPVPDDMLAGTDSGSAGHPVLASIVTPSASASRKRSWRMAVIVGVSPVVAVLTSAALSWFGGPSGDTNGPLPPTSDRRGADGAVVAGIAVGPPPPGLETVTEQQASLGAPTFTDPFSPSVTGHRVPPFATVEVSCKVYAPTFESLKPDGYWYRIASSPWNNEYYAAANTFLNGEITPPWRVFTNFEIPDC
jgi:hypothetical protein